jgi:hypothetical protein
MSNFRPPLPPGYSTLARTAIEATPVPRLVAVGRAIVLERYARGGGATRWYWIRSAADLSQVVELLRPGSAVSFYFDDRIAVGDPITAGDEIVAIAARDINAVVAAHSGQPELRVDFPAGPLDLAEFVDELQPGDTFLYGAYPAADNDGKRAVSVVLPDADGVVRRHPY